MIRGDSVNMHVVVALWRHQYERFLRYVRINFTWIFIEPALILLATAVGIGRLVGDVEDGLPYAEFVTPGIIIGQAMWLAIFETSWNAYNRITKGIYETQLSAPVTIFELTLGDIAWAATRAIMSVAAVMVFAAAFGWFTSWTAIGILIPAFMVALLFGALGYLFSATVPYVSFLSIVFTMVATPIYFFSGTFFPLSVLPDWAEYIGWILPLRPGVSIARGMASGMLSISHLWDALYMLGLTAILWFIAVKLLRRRLQR